MQIWHYISWYEIGRFCEFWFLRFKEINSIQQKLSNTRIYTLLLEVNNDWNLTFVSGKLNISCVIYIFGSKTTKYHFFLSNIEMLTSCMWNHAIKLVDKKLKKGSFWRRKLHCKCVKSISFRGLRPLGPQTPCLKVLPHQKYPGYAPGASQI